MQVQRDECVSLVWFHVRERHRVAAAAATLRGLQRHTGRERLQHTGVRERRLLRRVHARPSRGHLPHTEVRAEAGSPLGDAPDGTVSRSLSTSA